MALILYAVSPIGLGHAARAIAIADELGRRGFDIEFITGERVHKYISSYGYKTHCIISAPLPIELNGKILFSSLWYIRYWLGYMNSKGRVRKIVESKKPDLIIGDEEFSSLTTAIEKKLPNLMIADELELDFARTFISDAIESRVKRWYNDLQRSVDGIIVPEFGSNKDNMHFVGPIVRRATKSREEIRKELGIDDSKMILLSMSGSGLGRFLLKKVVDAHMKRDDDSYLVITGNIAGKLSGRKIIDLGFVRDNQNYIAAADLVISTAGKSTIDEALNFGTPIIAIPMKNHFEQEKNAIELGYRYDDIERIDELIEEKIAKREKPRNYNGDIFAADLIERYSRSI